MTWLTLAPSARACEPVALPETIEHPLHLGCWSSPTLYPGAPRRSGGIFVVPSATVLGLRGWADAREGVDDAGDPWVFFALEKIIRMMLRQSGLALELLAAPNTLPAHPLFDPHQIISSCLHAGVLSHVQDVTWRARQELDALTRARQLDALRVLLWGALLVEQRVLSLELADAIERWHLASDRELMSAFAAGEDVSLDRVTSLLDKLAAVADPDAEAARISLGSRPRGYDVVNAMLVACREVTARG